MPKPATDLELDIATGRSRLQKTWKNQRTTWLQLVKKLQTTHYTAETHEEYMAAKKDRQDEIKDIGGFVGGYLAGGRRLSGSVVHRQLITLDVDHITADWWDNLDLALYCSWCVYSTHKHTDAVPRLRLLIPLDREVMADEYEAIARRVAGMLNIDAFDDTTYQPQRLMYWPSTSKGSPYLYKYTDGPLLSADKILETYTDWADITAWPFSSRITEAVRKGMGKQGDPLEKPGVIGAFCRQYTITAAIERYLGHVYEPCDIPGRYTYKGGSTAGGLIMYDDQYAYSHHGTDPAGGKLCNAFDLVRLHLYGLQDENVDADTPINRRPSYKAMADKAAADEDVRLLIGRERVASAKDDFAGFFDAGTAEDEDLLGGPSAPAEPENDDWLKDMEADRNNRYYATINNIVLILENDRAFKGTFVYDDFEKQAIITRPLPWRKYNYGTRHLTDSDDDNVEHYIEAVYQISCGAKLKKAFSVISERHSVHPIREYLNAQAWDGIARLDTLIIDYLGADDSEYTRAVTRKAFTAAVARVFNPGCKFDYCLTFVGVEGLGKSTLIDKMGMQWYSDSLTTVHGKEAYEQLQGVWLLELAELAGLKKAEVETIKHFISKRIDRYRVAYGERTANYPRQCVPFGSTNKFDFLRGMTGNRRFWPMPINPVGGTKSVFNDLTPAEVGQLWAEAVMRYKEGEKLYLDKELEAVAHGMQGLHTETDDRRGLIEKYLATPLPESWATMDTYQRRAYLTGDETQPAGTRPRTKVCAAEIWVELLGGMVRDMTSQNTKVIHDIMRSLPNWLEYKSRTSFGVYGNQKGYYLAAPGEVKNITGDYSKPSKILQQG